MIGILLLGLWSKVELGGVGRGSGGCGSIELHTKLFEGVG